ncbi:MAG: DUF3135 domain-containing protein [Thiogranum sp.]|nr:DUF3135 domain-containing protein [Thiogranum sp.]
MPELTAQQVDLRSPFIDFDQWSELARRDPAAFEARRSEVIEEIIAAMPAHKQHRMRCLQWKIDQVRNQCATPMAACIKLSEMMWDSLIGPGGLNDTLQQLRSGDYEPPASARVLEFRSVR